METTVEGKPRRLRPSVIKGFRKQEIGRLAKCPFAVGSSVVTDGLSRWTAVTEAGCTNFPMGTGAHAAKWTLFIWVDAALSNIKTARAATYCHVSAKHTQRYLDSVA